eukprot:gnl/MRDRNA2_/MRDRNA2_59165_c0_seq1.p1 gnl/MRDRNA2_/MRDRNA2_59165_c0~~gnl/MRDRNA2_/MRDRNA2_59165_c0_seq1.p1  ORF type:complete len:1304 (-),score=294.04 gnl/MRDRNA2_/MRDRNA2_59165_c0_seq1:516-3950(-)
MAAPKCKVIRDGVEIDIDAKDLVPGDLVALLQGDAVPADLRLFEANELSTDEKLLTGESEDQLKILWPEDVDEPFAKNLCFGTTQVVNGKGKGIVIGTGMSTEVGKIAHQLKSAGGDGKTPLQKALNRLGMQIGSLSFCVLIIIIVLAWAVKYRDPTGPANPVLALVIVGVAFAVSSIPEGLPMVVTICLSLGSQDMVRRKAQVRKLPAVETLGSCSVICSDKTGTLTMGSMTAVRMCTFVRPKPGGMDLQEQVDEEANPENMNAALFDFFPVKGFHPNGGIFAHEDLDEGKQKKLIARWEEQQAANTVQKYDDIVEDYGDPAGRVKDTCESKAVRGFLLASFLNSYATKLKKGDEGLWLTTGNMSEGAIVTAAAKARFMNDSIHGEYERNSDLEVPFNSSRKMMATIHKLNPKDGPNKFGGLGFKLKGGHQNYTHFAVVKGAPDRLVPNIRYMLCDDDGEVNMDATPMSQQEKFAMNAMNTKLSSQALRVLAVCLRPITAADMGILTGMKKADDRLEFLLKGEHKEAGERRHSRGGAVGELCLSGLVGNMDPPRTGVKEAVETCHHASVRVIMITGDQKITACAVAQSISIIGHGDSLDEKSLVCSELHNDDGSLIPEEKIDAITRRVNVFSRAQPEDKIAIVQSLQKQGFVCAMTGDGVNDAPALKAADIGVAMGITGTEVAKGASDMVLLDDNFCTIVSAVEEGRKIYGNIQKFVCFLLGTNVGEIFYLSLSIILGLPLPIQALQVLFLNLMSDGCPAVAISKEPGDDDIMEKPPRPKKSNIMNRDCVLWVNMPHQLGITVIVISCVVIAMHTQVGNIFQKDINNLCQGMPEGSIYPTFKDKAEMESKCPYPDSCPYYCHCQRLKGGEYISTIQMPENRPQWIKTKEGEILYDWDFKQWATRDPEGTQPRSTKDADGNWQVASDLGPIRFFEEEGRRLTEDESDGSSRRLAGGGGSVSYTYIEGYDVTCVEQGIKWGRTTSFMCAVMCEMMRAYTVKSVKPFYETFLRNMWMHAACMVSFLLTLFVTMIPGVKDIFRLDNPEWYCYFIAVAMALGCSANDEHAKIWYRAELKRRSIVDKGMQAKDQLMEKIEICVEMLQKVMESQARTDAVTFETRKELASVKATLHSLPQDIKDKSMAKL